MTKKIVLYSLAAIVITSTALTSCAAIKNANNTQKGASIGTAAGSILGAIIGNNVGNKKNSKLGAVLGGVIGGVTGGVIGNKMDKQAREIEASVPGAQVERVGEGIKLTLGENAVRFNTSKSTLTATAQENLDKLITVFDHYGKTNIVIYGYTDSRGKVEYNQTLSEQRATAVKDYLVAKGMATDRFETQGLGINDPIDTNETAEGRAKNRRVEFAIVASPEMIEAAKKEAESARE